MEELLRRQLGDKTRACAGYGDGGGGEKLGCCCGASAGDGGGRKMEMVSAAQCGRVLGALRRALAWLGRTGQGTGDARRASAPCGIQALKLVGHRERRFGSFSRAMVSLTAYFGDVHSVKP